MKLDPIVVSLLDTDLYKFNMNQVIFHKHTNLTGEYRFRCRNAGVVFTEEMKKEIEEQTDALCALRFSEDELDYLRSIRFIKDDYVEFMRLWHPIRDYVDISLDGGELKVTVRGPLFSAMQFEIYLLEIINEVYFRMKYDYEILRKSARERLDAKIDAFNSGRYTFSFAEFGCRRRLSAEWEDEVVRRMATELINRNMVGTSNVYLAKKYKVLAVGTMAHEFIMCVGQGNPMYNPAYSNKLAMDAWTKEYGVLNGTYLTDTIGDETAHLDMGYTYSICFAGVRHDSGDPYKWGDEWVAHFQKYYDKYHDERVNPKSKTLLFSDSLDFERASALYSYFKDKSKVAFGIGTYIANDTDVPSLNIVMKVTECNNRPVAKLSNAGGKTMCEDDEYVEYLKKSIEWRLAHTHHK